MKVIKFIIIITIIAGFVGEFLGMLTGFPNIGIIFAIAVMGGFIMSEIRKKDKE